MTLDQLPVLLGLQITEVVGLLMALGALVGIAMSAVKHLADLD